MPGPPKKPTMLKLLAGNPGKKRLNLNEPKYDIESAVCPKELDRDAQIVFRKLLPQLEKHGFVNAGNVYHIAWGCSMIAIMMRACAWVKSDGEYVVESGPKETITEIIEELKPRRGRGRPPGGGNLGNRGGKVVPGAAFNTLVKVGPLVTNFLREYGMTPSSAANIMAIGPPVVDSFDSL